MHGTDSAVASRSGTEVYVDRWETKHPPKRVGNGERFGLHTTIAGATVHLRTASVTKLSGAGCDQHPVDHVMVVVTAFSVDIGEGVSEAYVGHFSDHHTDWTRGDILGCKVKERGQGGVVMVRITRYSPTPALAMSKGNVENRI